MYELQYFLFVKPKGVIRKKKGILFVGVYIRDFGSIRCQKYLLLSDAFCGLGINVGGER